MSASLKNPPAPLLHFKRGDHLVYRAPGSEIGTPVTVKSVVVVRRATKRVRYYALEGMPGIILPADRLAWA